MQDLERRLQFTMVAYVGGGRPLVSCDLVHDMLVRRLGLPREGFSVHPYRPEDFLIVFSTAEMRNRVARQPALEHAGVQLFFRKWTRLAQASFEIWRTKVHLVIEGIPPHAWDEAVVRELLGSSCEIEEIAPETSSREDQASFKVTAWTDELERIPPARTLVVPEPEVREDDTPSPAREFSDDTRSPPPRRRITEKSVLKYKVLIHVDRVEEESDPDDRAFAPAPGSEDSPQSGLPSPPERGGCHGGLEPRTKGAPAGQGEPLVDSVRTVKWQLLYRPAGGFHQ
jgi:hypothetical protein